MKKLVAILLVAVLAVSMVACTSASTTATSVIDMRFLQQGDSSPAAR